MQISLNPVSAVLSKLRTGFNPNLAACCATYGFSAAPFTISFPASITARPTSSFFMGKIDDQEIDLNGIPSNFWMCLWTEVVQDSQLEKPRDFAGQSQVYLDVSVYWKGGNAHTVNFEAMSLAVEDAVAECVQAYNVSNWGAGVVYNGTFACVRGPVKDDDKGGFRQKIRFNFGFNIYV